MGVGGGGGGKGRGRGWRVVGGGDVGWGVKSRCQEPNLKRQEVNILSRVLRVSVSFECAEVCYV